MAMSSSTTSGVSASARRTALSPSLAVPTRCDAVDPREQQLQPLGGQRLVVGDQDSERLSLSHRSSTGMVSETLIAAVGIGPNRHSRALPKRASSRWQTLARPRPVPSWVAAGSSFLPPFLSAVGDLDLHPAAVERRARLDADDDRLAASPTRHI